MLLADIGYFRMHHISYEVRLFRVTHPVHYNSPIFNAAVVFHYSPFDSLSPPIFHAPTVLLGVYSMLAVSARSQEKNSNSCVRFRDWGDNVSFTTCYGKKGGVCRRYHLGLKPGLNGAMADNPILSPRL